MGKDTTKNILNNEIESESELKITFPPST